MLAQFQKKLALHKKSSFKNQIYKQHLEAFIKRYALIRTILSNDEKDELVQTYNNIDDAYT
jgi:hypothetical protein